MRQILLSLAWVFHHYYWSTELVLDCVHFCFLNGDRYESYVYQPLFKVGCVVFGSDGKESACSAGDLDLIPGSGRYPGEGNNNPLQYPCLENPMDRGAWQDTVQGVTKSQTWLNDFYLSQEPFSNLFFPKPDSHFPSIAFSLKWWDSDRGSPLGADGKAHFSDERNRHSWSSPPVCLKWGHEA